KMIDLPDDLQLAPIFSFQKLNTTSANGNMYLSGGNFFDVIPYEGRYDAQPLALFGINKNNAITYFPEPLLSGLKGQVRDVRMIHTAKNEEAILVARNNENIKLYKKN